jgi:hypothetical protein
MSNQLRFTPLPKTQLTFINVPLVPVRTRKGEPRYLCATWGGAMHLFDAEGREKVIAYPDGSFGAYAFAPAVEDGFAWVVHTGGIITRLDVDKGEIDFSQPVPLRAMTLGATMTPDGFLVATSSGFPPRSEVMVYDTRQRRVAHMFEPISRRGNVYGWYPRLAPDGCVVIPIAIPGGELVRLDPRTGRHENLRPREDEPAVLPAFPFDRALSFLPDGRLAFPHGDRIATVTYPDLRDADSLAYPDSRKIGWAAFRDHGDGRLFAYHAEGGPLYRLDDTCAWRPYLERFSPKIGNVTLDKFCALPGQRLLGMSLFGELVRLEQDGTPKRVAQLDNLGYQHIGHVRPTEGSRVFTTTFINMSFQELDTTTGKGRNIRPCQSNGGQVAGTAWHAGKLWLACYGGAEITVYDPAVPGEWPANPRHVLDIGEEQMRPQGLVSDGRHLWTATSAKYGLLGGALARIDPKTETVKVWRNLAPDHNPTGVVVDAPGRRVYAGTTVNADQGSAPPAPLPAVVIAFDMDREAPAWIARPAPDAQAMRVLALPEPGLVMVAAWPGYPAEILLLDAATGSLQRKFDSKLPPEWKGESFLVGGDDKLYVACDQGLFRYDLERGPGEKVLDGPVLNPVVRGTDLFFIRGHELGIAEKLFSVGCRMGEKTGL